jgi:molecular chaperone GrpE
MVENLWTKQNRTRKPAEEEPEEIRVTDRRRIHIDDGVSGTADSSFEEPNLKPSYVEELESRASGAEQKLAEVQSRFEQLRKQLQRETDETRQRLNRAADERANREKANFIADLLPVRDNLQRAIAAAENNNTTEAILDGLKSTITSFDAALTAAGVEPLLAIGEKFDPEKHDAIDLLPVDAAQDGLVVSEYAKGYRIGDRLLRPARVRVGKSESDTERRNNR